MYTEFTINSNEYKIYVENEFHSFASLLHKHNYSEIHVIANGNSTFTVDETPYHLKSGNILAIPQGVFHCCDDKDESTLHFAFQIDYKLDSPLVNFIDSHTILNFILASRESQSTRDFSTISDYIVLICRAFFHNKELPSRPVTDYGFLIHEFFSGNFNYNLQLSDLAEFLHLSERQAERLVIKYTGNTFRNELTNIRMKVAKKLLSTSQKSLTEIAQYVGYESYTGFWKAWNKYNMQNHSKE